MEKHATLGERTCQNPDCKKPLDPERRRDARFCNEYCRTAFHNPKRSITDPEILRINKILAKNCQILMDIFEKSSRKPIVPVEQSKLIKLGFRFDYFTQVHNDLRFCYTYGYKPGTTTVINIYKRYDSIK